MNRGLLLKSLVDARAVTVLLATAMLLAEGVLSYVLLMEAIGGGLAWGSALLRW